MLNIELSYPSARPLHNPFAVSVKAIDDGGPAFAVLELCCLRGDLNRFGFYRKKSPGWNTISLDGECPSGAIPDDRELRVVTFSHHNTSAAHPYARRTGQAVALPS
jgi:hypothetical protein